MSDPVSSTKEITKASGTEHPLWEIQTKEIFTSIMLQDSDDMRD